MENKLNIENWKWCEICNCITYINDCDCAGSLCNGGGCCDCDWQYALAKKALEIGDHPSKESLQRIVIDNYKNYITHSEYNNTENILLEKFLGGEIDTDLYKLAQQELSASYGKI